MTIKNINKKSKFRNTKLFKGLVIGGCTLTIIATLTGCGKDNEIDKLIKNDVSFQELLDSVSNKTNIDEALANTNYTELLNEYMTARQNKDLNKCCEILAEIGNNILKSSICDTFINENIINNFNDLKDISFEFIDIKDEFDNKVGTKAIITITYSISNEKIVSGNINVNNDYVVKKYLAKDELYNLLSDINKCKEKNIDNLQDIDKIFESYERYLFTTGNISNEREYDGKISNKYDDEKIKVLKK